MAAAVDLVHFTDPGCPFAWSAEPHRLRLRWLFGDQLTWTTRMVVLAETGQDYLDKGFTTEKLSGSLAGLAERFGMPIDASPRERMAGTAPACLAFVGAREHGGDADAADRLLRTLRVGQFSGRPLDDDATIERAAQDAGIDPAALRSWMSRVTLDEDRRLARTPDASALALEHKLASADDSDVGWRYTCPSLEMTAGEMTVTAPGMQPFESYEVALAHLAPELERRDDAEDVGAVLEWAPFPLATREVGDLLGVEREEAREQLVAAGATKRPLGSDAFWVAA